MKIITYHIQLGEPVLVTSLAGDPNTATSFDYLPGSVLRGAVISAYTRQNKFDDKNDDVQRLFLNGRTQYLNGYLKDREDQRSLPSPLSWQQDKKDQQQETEATPAAVLDFAYEEQDDDPEKQWKGVKKPLFSFLKTAGKIRWLSADKVLAVHTQRDPVKGRSTSDQGAVYQYEALAAGQTFVAQIVCHEDGDTAVLVDLLKGTHQIGGARGAGYGRVIIDPETITTTAVREMPGTLTLQSNERLLVTCLSDLLLQDKQGQFQVDPTLVKIALEKRLDCTLSWFGGDQPNAFINGTYVGGFNRKWGLPLPQAKAISMGSVFVFEPSDGVTIDKLQEVEAAGLGLRRAEGFGRVAFNWQTEPEWAIEIPPPPERPSPITVESATPEGKLLQTMVNRLFRQQLDARVAVKANEWAAKLPVQNSQLSRLRQVVQDELHERPSEDDGLATKIMQDGRDRLIRYSNKLKERNTTRKQFDKARINSKPLLDWFEARVKDEKSEIDTLLSLASTPKIGETTGQWTAVMRYEYNLRLIDLTLAYCLKNGKEGN